LPEYVIEKVDNLVENPLRDLRQNVLERLRERIRRGFNPARPLSVVEEDGKKIVVDGNHRLKVLRELGIKEVPCLVYDEKEIQNTYRLAIECNEDENTYAPLDLFDYLEIIKKLREEGKTQKEIAEMLGEKWSRGRVSQYMMLLDKVATNVLEFCKQHQKDRVAENATTVAFKFTERWFRDSGIYNLPVIYDDEGNVIRNRQMEFMKWFIEKKKCRTNMQTIKKQVEMLINKEKCIEYIVKNLLNKDKVEEFISYVENGSWKSLEDVKRKVDEENKRQDKFRLIEGDFREVGKEIKDGSIDLIVTDPPYGKEYLHLWDDLGAFAKRVLKPGGILVTYSGQYHLPTFIEKLKKHLEYFWILALKHTGSTQILNNVDIRWKPILVFYKPPKPELTDVIKDLIEGKRSKDHFEWEQSVHESRILIRYFSNPKDRVLDPMAGSGTVLIAGLLEDRRVIGIEVNHDRIQQIKGRVARYEY